MAEVARRLRVAGRVQGVFFRAWTTDVARTLGLNGWVRNCSDGSVEAHAEGDEDAVGELIDLMREGPPNAQVETVEVEAVEPEGPSDFQVRS